MQLTLQNIESKIYSIRGIQVMLDSDLALLYQTETKFINRAVKRNPERFPKDFVFTLTDKEWQDLRFQIGTLKEITGQGKHRKYLPIVFTEQGVAMLSAVLHTEIAIHVSIQIIQAFVAMRKSMSHLQGLLQRIDGIEWKQLQTDKTLEKILQALEKDLPKSKGIFFEGQLFDAHVFVSDLIRKSKRTIVLIDNYVNEETLLLLSKRQTKVECVIHTRINPILKSDLIKHNQQYPAITLYNNKGSHDRFLIIDDQELYHFGASLKDLGKKCFAFSRMDELLPAVRLHLL
ncbi:MAG: ORF6N domain-containing protein [Bacteroidota bacterium]